MENWFRSIFLTLVVFGLTLSPGAMAADETDVAENSDEQSSLVQPRLSGLNLMSLRLTSMISKFQFSPACLASKILASTQ